MIHGSRLRVLAGTAVCALLLVGCAAPEEEAVDPASPEGTVQLFFEHLNQGRGQEALAMYSDDARQALEDPEVFEAWIDQITREKTIDEVRIVDSLVGEEGTAKVDFEIVYADGSSVARTVELVGGDGDWRMGLIL